MANLYLKKRKKKFSYVERRDYHTAVMRKGFRHGGMLDKKETYSAGFAHWDSDLETDLNILGSCDKEQYQKGKKAGSKAYGKALTCKF